MKKASELTVFSTRDTCELVLEHLDHNSFLLFGQACKDFNNYMKRSPRYSVLQVLSKTINDPLLYETIYTKLKDKWQKAMTYGIPQTHNVNVVHIDVQSFATDVIECLDSFYQQITRASINNVNRFSTLKDISQLKRQLALVMPLSEYKLETLLQNLDVDIHSAFIRPFAKSLMKLLTTYQNLNDASKVQFRKLLLHTQTSCFADLYTLLESTQLFLQHLQTPSKSLPQLFFNSYSSYQQQISGTSSAISRRETLRSCLNSRPAKLISAGATFLLFYSLLEARRQKPMSSFVTITAFLMCILIFVRLRGIFSLAVSMIQDHSRTRLAELESNAPSLELNEESDDTQTPNPFR